jgi:hypothetical protein
MKTITGTIRNGQIVTDQPIDWPEGYRVAIEPLEQETLGIREEHWPVTSKEIARHLALLELVEPLEMSPEEEAEWKEALEKQKEWEKNNYEKTTSKVEGLFQ